jgi:hypothetical protein
MAFVAALSLVGAFLFKSGAMEHSFARFAATPHANAVVPPPTPETHSNLQSPESTERIGDRDAGSPWRSTNAAKSNSDSSTRASRPDSQPREAQHDRAQKSNLPLSTAQNARKTPRAASVFPATTTLEHNLSSDHSQTNSVREPSATKDITLGATASSDAPPANSNGITSNSSAAARATSISPGIPPSPVAKELSANSTHSNDVATGLPETLAFNSNVAAASSASSRNSAAPLAQPVVQVDPPARQVLEIRLASGYRPAFFNVPNVTVVESCCATMRIQRSVRLPSGNSHWPFHRNAKIVVGGLISRIDPQSAQIRTGAREYVRVHATVAQDGQVTSVWPVSGPVNLIPGVVKAVQGWRYQPTLINGKPVETQADVLIQFHTSPSHSALP